MLSYISLSLVSVNIYRYIYICIYMYPLYEILNCNKWYNYVQYHFDFLQTSLAVKSESSLRVQKQSFQHLSRLEAWTRNKMVVILEHS